MVPCDDNLQRNNLSIIIEIIFLSIFFIFIRNIEATGNVCASDIDVIDCNGLSRDNCDREWLMREPNLWNGSAYA